MIKKMILPLILSIVCCGSSYAKMIELNTQNADVCKQQLLSAHDTKPVIFMNIKGLKLSENLLPVYQQISKDFPKKAFFTFTVENPNDVMSKTAQACLDAKTLDTPYVYAYVISPATKKEKGYFIANDNMKLSDNSTKQDIEKFFSF